MPECRLQIGRQGEGWWFPPIERETVAVRWVNQEVFQARVGSLAGSYPGLPQPKLTGRLVEGSDGNWGTVVCATSIAAYHSVVALVLAAVLLVSALAARFQGVRDGEGPGVFGALAKYSAVTLALYVAYLVFFRLLSAHDADRLDLFVRRLLAVPDEDAEKPG